MFKKLIKTWKTRQRYKFSEMPDFLLAIYLLSSSLVAGYFGYVLKIVLPKYLDVANRLPLIDWGTTGFILTIFLLCLLVFVGFFSGVAYRCNKIAMERWLE